MAVVVFPPVEIWWMGLLAWFPLLLALQGASAKIGFRLGLLWGVLTYGVTLSWLWTLFGVMAIPLWIMLASFIGIFGLAYGRLTTEKRTALWPGLLAAVLWVGVEYFRSEIFSLRFPWITPGTGLPPNGLTPIVGVYGVSFVVLLGSAWLVSSGWVTKLVGTGTLLVMMAFVLGPRFFSEFVGSPVGNNQFKVALVQGEEGFLDNYLDRTNAVPVIVDAVVWPEYAVGYDVRKNVADMEKLDDLVGDRTKMITLGSRTKIGDEKRYNTAVTIGEAGVLGAHHKNHPVHFFDDGEPGPEQESFDTPVGKVGTPICFDCDYSDVVRKMTASGAEVFLVPSMDAKNWSAKQHEQHGALFRHRAAENHRWIAVAASSGVTQIINPGGETVERLDHMDEGVLLGSVGLSDRKTIFTKRGWMLGPFCVWVAALLLGWICYKLGCEWYDRRQSGLGGRSRQGNRNRAVVGPEDFRED